ncbi:MAG: FAD-dependent monooxygenase [Hyphomicrobiaceae bacterium]
MSEHSSFVEIASDQLSARATDHGAYDVAVVGGGHSGLATALSLAHAAPGPRPGSRIAMIGPKAASPGAADTRTVALFGPSLALLGRLGVLAALERTCAPITGIRLVDDTGGLLRAPEMLFRPEEIGLDRFGLNVPNGLLVDLLEAAVADAPAIARIEASVVAVEIGPDAVHLTLGDGGTMRARLAVAADGRHSRTRETAGLTVRTWDYEQAAIVTRFTHSRPHGGISSEVHRGNGPCTVVPLPGNESSLVWVERPAVARRLAELGDDAFRAALDRALLGLAGRITTVAPRRAIALTGLKPARFGQRRVALVGEAAHVFPPIGAQGLNLGLRDAASLADAIAEHGTADVGTDRVLAAYDADRQVDVGTRALGVDLLGRSLTSPNPLLGLARGLGLQIAHSVPPLRRAMIAAGMRPVGRLPVLMRQ